MPQVVTATLGLFVVYEIYSKHDVYHRQAILLTFCGLFLFTSFVKFSVGVKKPPEGGLLFF